MSKRTERRAAERAARKNQTLQIPASAAPQTLTATASGRIYPRTYDSNYVFQDDPDPAGLVPVPSEPSGSRTVANRLNALKSTGPVTPEGKAASALNALKTGLTGNTVLLDSDDAEAYQQRLNNHVEQWRPATFEERRLVQSIHDAAWRLDRILNLESTIYAKGRIELQSAFSELPEHQRKSFIQLEIADRNEKKLRNLSLQESRIQRQRAKDIAALKQLIAERIAQEQAVLEDAAKSQSKPQPGAESTTAIGFEFSNPETPVQTTIPEPLQDAA